MIRSFADSRTERFWRTGRGRMPADVGERARRKLAILDAAVRLDDLSSPPGNRLEALHGRRKGQHSIRVNEQWRICFTWMAGDAYEVEITDCH